jgi:class 3 adenylate cyclase
LRVAFSLSFLLVAEALSRRQTIQWFIHLALAIGLCATYLINPTWLDQAYRTAYIIFPVATAIALYDLGKAKQAHKPVGQFQSITAFWLIAQAYDTGSIWLATGSPLAPALLLFICAHLIYINHYNRLRSEKLEFASARILTLLDSNIPVRELVSQIASILSEEIHFKRVSAYVDAFCVGSREHPHQVFIKTLEYGYDGIANMDPSVVFDQSRGKVMLEALTSQKSILRQGRTDQAWFAVLPIGKHVCFNFSDDTPRSSDLAFESIEILSRLKPALIPLDHHLVALGLEQKTSLQKLRSLKGDGSWDIEAGSIFVDVNNYSVGAEEFGLRFTEFVSNLFFPSLVKALGEYAVPEHVVGDEAHFLVLQEFLEKDVDTSRGVMRALQALDAFIYGDGAHLCVRNGFEALTVSVGVNIGTINLVCDGISARTSGRVINEAKRLQDEAGRAGILVSCDVNLPAESFGFRFGDTLPILVKKNLITAKRLMRSPLIH